MAPPETRVIHGLTGIVSATRNEANSFGGFNPSGNLYRNAAAYNQANPLPNDAGVMIDAVLTTIGMQRFQLGQLFYRNNLVTRLEDWIGVLSVERQRIGRTGRASRSMVPDNGRGERLKVPLDWDRTPIFATWEPFDLDARSVGAAGRKGMDLETTHVAEATRAINSSIEEQGIFGLLDRDGSAMKMAGLSAPGLLSTTSLTTHTDWTTLTGPDISSHVMSMILTLTATFRNGPYALLYPRNYMGILQEPYNATNPVDTIAQHLMKLGPFEGKALELAMIDSLPDGDVAVVELSKNTADFIEGEQPTAISWVTPPMTQSYCVVACGVFRFFVDGNGTYGVVVSHEV